MRPLRTPICYLACLIYAVLGVGGAFPLGLCFESDGRVGLEAMVGGSCASLSTAADAQAHSEYAGMGTADHCVSCEDVILPLESISPKCASRAAVLPPAAMAPAIVPPPSALVLASGFSGSEDRLSSPVLAHLSTVVLRA